MSALAVAVAVGGCDNHRPAGSRGSPPHGARFLSAGVSGVGQAAVLSSRVLVCAHSKTTRAYTCVLLAHAQDMPDCGYQYDNLDNQPSTGPTTRMVTQSMSIAVPPYHNRLTRLGTG